MSSNEYQGDYISSQDRFYRDTFSNGWVPMPHGLLNLLRDGKMSKSAYLLMGFLLHFENRHKTKDGWNHVTDAAICKHRLLSSKKVVSARRELKTLLLIDYRQGYSHHATEYLILIPKKYRSAEKRVQ